jgi:hypothetical protein
LPQLVNPETDSLQTNERVQECLAKAKQTRKLVVRYIQACSQTAFTLIPRDSLFLKQLVENEELIGTLIETNERIITAMEMYDRLVAASPDATDVSTAITAGLAAAHIDLPESEVNRLQERQRMAVERVKQAGSVRGKDRSNDTNLHPDLQDLSFGPLGDSSNDLPPPLRPSTALSDDGNGQEETFEVRGSLSDFSDYDSSDEESHNAAGSSKRRGGRHYVDVSDDPDDHPAPSKSMKAPQSEADPFADPFADDGPSRRL